MDSTSQHAQSPHRASRFGRFVRRLFGMSPAYDTSPEVMATGGPRRGLSDEELAQQRSPIKPAPVPFK
jgi:hypothetical protein